MYVLRVDLYDLGVKMYDLRVDLYALFLYYRGFFLHLPKNINSKNSDLWTTGTTFLRRIGSL